MERVVRLLLLEDDQGQGEGLRAFLQTEGHAVDWCRRLIEARALHAETFDAYLVDWQLPDGSGIEWVRDLRRRGVSTPVIVLTARDLISDRIQGLDSGADDYLLKPFDPEELCARVRAVTRRAGGMAGPRQQFGAVEIDFSARAVFVDGVIEPLTAREWTLLEALALRAGRLVAKPDLEALVHGLDNEVASNSVEVHISSLRRKLGRGLIETVRGMGYRVLP
jgi:two-component system, OmpR family, response regulator